MRVNNCHIAYLPTIGIGLFLSQPTQALEKTLVDFSQYQLGSIVTTNATVSYTSSAPDKVLLAHFDPTVIRPNVYIPFTTQNRDLSKFQKVNIDLYNAGKSDVAVLGNVWGSIWGDGWLAGQAVVHPNETQTLTIILGRSDVPTYLSTALKGLGALPGYPRGVVATDASRNIDGINLNIFHPKDEGILEVRRIAAADSLNPPSEAWLQSGFFPFIDVYGQYKHWEWPGKVHSDQDLTNQYVDELSDLSAHVGPSDRSIYGGWLKGTRLTATGHFRTAKVGDKWWLVDPQGYLFWSTGIDCVTFGMWSDGASNYFESPGDFYQRNHAKKYGASWLPTTVSMAHLRLKSWGINTIANWSDSKIYQEKKTPYVVALQTKGVVAASHDSTTFQSALHTALLAEIGKSTEDPWCIGYYVDNEIHDWGDSSQATLEKYYASVKNEIKKVAPNKLYLGSRQDFPFYDGSDSTGLESKIIRAAAKSVDVMSFNRYRFSVEDLHLPIGVDMPMIIGEFQFGALDRGLAGGCMRTSANQEQRARAYEHFVRTALENPGLVGVHWFEYLDQPFTGRGDGENSQNGFVDITDKPYPEIVAASRRVNYGLYEYRSTGSTSIRPKSPPAAPFLQATLRNHTLSVSRSQGSPVELHMFDARGRHILTKTFSGKSENIPVPDLPMGIYLLKVRGLAGRFSQCIVNQTEP